MNGIPAPYEAPRKALDIIDNGPVYHITTPRIKNPTLAGTAFRKQIKFPIGWEASNLQITDHDAPEVESCYAKAIDLLMDAGETRDLFVSFFGLWRHYLVRGDRQKTREVATRLYELSQKLNDHSALTAAERVMCTSCYYWGQNALAVKHAEKGVSLRRPEEMLRNALLYLNEPTISCLGYWAMALWHLGAPDQARQKIDEAIRQSRDLGHAHTLTISRLFDSMLAQFCRQTEQTRDKAKALISLCSQGGICAGKSRVRSCMAGPSQLSDTRKQASNS